MAVGLVSTGVQFPDSTIQTTAAGGGANIQSFTATGTYTKPSGAKFVYVELWSGADGGNGGGPTGGVGGRGGSYAYKMFAAPDVGATVTVTIGAGGAGGSGTPFSPPLPPNTGGAGGNTNFGTLLYAYGGTSNFFYSPPPAGSSSPLAGFWAFCTARTSNLQGDKIAFYAGGQGGGACCGPVGIHGMVSFFGGGGGGQGGYTQNPPGSPPSAGGKGGKGRAFGSSSCTSQSPFTVTGPPGSPGFWQRNYGGGGGAGATAWVSSTAAVAGNAFNGGGGGKGSLQGCFSCPTPACSYPSQTGAAGGLAGGGGGGGARSGPSPGQSPGKAGGAGGNGYAIVYTW